MSTVTCHTDGCENEGVPIEVDRSIDVGDGEVVESPTVVCGPCGQQITDITE